MIECCYPHGESARPVKAVTILHFPEKDGLEPQPVCLDDARYFRQKFT